MPSRNINMGRFLDEEIDGKFTGLRESEIPASDRKGEKANIVVENAADLSQTALTAMNVIDPVIRTPGRHEAFPGEVEPKRGIPGISGAGKHVKH